MWFWTSVSCWLCAVFLGLAPLLLLQGVVLWCCCGGWRRFAGCDLEWNLWGFSWWGGLLILWLGGGVYSCWSGSGGCWCCVGKGFVVFILVLCVVGWRGWRAGCFSGVSSPHGSGIHLQLIGVAVVVTAGCLWCCCQCTFSTF